MKNQYEHRVEDRSGKLFEVKGNQILMIVRYMDQKPENPYLFKSDVRQELAVEFLKAGLSVHCA